MWVAAYGGETGERWGQKVDLVLFSLPRLSSSFFFNLQGINPGRSTDDASQKRVFLFVPPSPPPLFVLVSSEVGLASTARAHAHALIRLTLNPAFTEIMLV